MRKHRVDETGPLVVVRHLVDDALRCLRARSDSRQSIQLIQMPARGFAELTMATLCDHAQAISDVAAATPALQRAFRKWPFADAEHQRVCIEDLFGQRGARARHRDDEGRSDIGIALTAQRVDARGTEGIDDGVNLRIEGGRIVSALASLRMHRVQAVRRQRSRCRLLVAAIAVVDQCRAHQQLRTLAVRHLACIEQAAQHRRLVLWQLRAQGHRQPRDCRDRAWILRQRAAESLDRAIEIAQCDLHMRHCDVVCRKVRLACDQCAVFRNRTFGIAGIEQRTCALQRDIVMVRVRGCQRLDDRQRLVGLFGSAQQAGLAQAHVNAVRVHFTRARQPQVGLDQITQFFPGFRDQAAQLH